MQRSERRVVARQFIRYALVGLASNAVLFVIYLLMVWLGASPKLAMSLVYLVGVAQTFVFNKGWTFAHSGPSDQAFPRYVALYAFGYVTNWCLIELLVYRLGWPHQAVMGGLIVVMALFFFVGLKFWVFRPVVGNAGGRT
ncbi:GtrA family protein [Roseateles toxinivorans]|uniref:Putative flippase GtrA n=1 Tax=Roseateles toxinivorans TaxID=270368 RepID=A0A4R6QU27_9BURK|nr:GtrA family protein [Roseateles toxinivorans]TDP74633.1 putative flippase GtrA [Roseateles toxinivorans]